MQKTISFLTSRRKQQLGFILLGLATFVVVLPILILIVFVTAAGLPAISWEFLSAMPSNGMRAGGILPAILGTFYLTLGTALFAVPPGIAAAIYLAEYALLHPAGGGRGGLSFRIRSG